MGMLTPDMILLVCVLPLWFLPLQQQALAYPGEVRDNPWALDENYGYVPSEYFTPDNEIWWNQRYKRQEDEGTLGEFVLPPVDDSISLRDFPVEASGGVVKRDYTAAQLLNMLRQLARTRKHRQIRIAGKSLRFGISRK